MLCGRGIADIRRIVENTRKKPFSRALDVPNKRLKSRLSSMIPNEPKITPELVASHGLKPDDERVLNDRVLCRTGRT
jgi:hypothetical protein